jgi:hypothetical protein
LFGPSTDSVGLSNHAGDEFVRLEEETAIRIASEDAELIVQDEEHNSPRTFYSVSVSFFIHSLFFIFIFTFLFLSEWRKDFLVPKHVVYEALIEFKREGIERRRGHLWLFQDSMLLTQAVINSGGKLEDHYFQYFNFKDITLFTYAIGTELLFSCVNLFFLICR